MTNRVRSRGLKTLILAMEGTTASTSPASIHSQFNDSSNADRLTLDTPNTLTLPTVQSTRSFPTILTNPPASEKSSLPRPQPKHHSTSSSSVGFQRSRCGVSSSSIKALLTILGRSLRRRLSSSSSIDPQRCRIASVCSGVVEGLLTFLSGLRRRLGVDRRLEVFVFLGALGCFGLDW
jgi:hypothetical protein